MAGDLEIERSREGSHVFRLSLRKNFSTLQRGFNTALLLNREKYKNSRYQFSVILRRGVALNFEFRPY